MKYKIHRKNPTWFKKGEKSAFSGHKHSLESREKMSKSLKGKPSWNKNKKLHYTIWNKGKSYKSNNALEIWRKNGGQSWNKGLKFKKEEHPLYGKKFSKESKIKMRKSRLEYLKTHSVWDKGLHIWKDKKHPMLGKKHPKSGEKHYNWKGGVSNEPYSFDFNNELKEKIRKRDNYECQICKITEEEHLIVYGQPLCIHHIDYNKLNSVKDNLITLCHSCHTRTNFNRNYWKIYFVDKILDKEGVKNDIS